MKPWKLLSCRLQLAGAAVLGVGIWIRVDKNQFELLLGSSLYQISAYVLIGAGALVFFVGFSGCCGAVKESKCLLWTYFGLLFLIFAIEVVAAILAFVFFETVNAEIEKQINVTISERYGKNSFEVLNKAVDALQSEMKCCGSENWRDWQQWNDSRVPWSCCERAVNKSCPSLCNLNINYNDTTDPSGIYSKGCKPQLLDWAKENLIILGALGIATAFIELLGMIFACCLIKAIDDQ
ncbi:CD151 antigen [Lingula anatina]|uniref:Tetraspanin n=1 Tax=Lingula anatina TaxID=7574 RepID=A0A1S3K3J5_LINAN|nr:CD151 antigen [Lingula anatina]|eukprot:XP_013417092.1 CD151 antigen [Lingula anatina]